MNRKTVPTSAFVGPAALRLENQSGREPVSYVRPAAPCLSAKSWLRSFLVIGLILILAAIWDVQFAVAADPYATVNELSPPELNYYVQERNQRAAAEQQELFRKRIPIRDAVGDKVLEDYFERQKAKIQTPAPAPVPFISNRTLLITVLSFVSLILLIRKLAPELFVAINKKFNPWAQTAATTAGVTANVRAEDEAFSEFIAGFRTGPNAVAGGAAAKTSSVTEHGVLMDFYANASKTLVGLQKFIQEISQATKGVACQKLLADLHRELGTFKGAAGLPELLPAWQMVSALEGLARQLSGKAGDVNRSTLRTMAAGVDLLKDLCAPGLPADLLTNPPIRLLVVDDELISRNAVAHALKKAFNTPDLAEHGEAALALAAERAYDVVFLDVQMPGMDGYEVCTRVHGTAPNSTTPVVFVTCHSDFEARAQSMLCGGNDLIGKPFLTFEITVKALTLALQARLSKRAQLANLSESRGPASSATAKDCSQNLVNGEKAVVAANGSTGASGAAKPTDLTQRPHFKPGEAMAADGATTPGELSSKDLLRAFLVRAATNLPPLRDLIQTLFRVTDENVRQEMLSDFFLRFNALAPQGVSAGEHPALRLCTALEGLLTKMVGHPKNCTSSTLLTVATAVDLFLDLCDPGVRTDLMTEPPVHLLVVDDDPVARRAITGALQMSFEKPDSADTGEAALALAAQKPFDAIFLDVEMPGMDGFAACLRIRETQLNRSTPVVFVTGHSDFKARSQSVISGGNDLLAKPFLPAEIKVKALTFVLRGRLQKDKSAHHAPALPRAEESPKEELVPA
jgi:CheY-like chemotaxis protein